LSEIDIHDYEVIEDLSKRWGDDFLGWTLNKSKDKYAIFMRVPEKYVIKDTEVSANPEQLFFNEIRVPVGSSDAITMYLKKVGGIEWSLEDNFFERSETNIKESISNFPKYFKIFNEATMGRLDLTTAEELTDKIIEVWK